ncbi:two-component system sensor histidine kinase NtrB [Salsuginibacillus kocurii]|uniref:two-component system sensor histidine kinase NtrB n=1 Tax=Salsuginibacillus kocurii TaxID=427078 RepID=UPI0003793DBE|nr:ATP-binding protein [Salsuginibacillus kocurii]
MAYSTIKPNLTEYASSFAALSREVQLVVSHEGSIVTMNKVAKRFFNDVDNWFDILQPEDREKAQDFFANLHKSQGARRIRLTHFTEKGKKTFSYEGMEDRGHVVLVGKIPEEASTQIAGIFTILKKLKYPALLVDNQLNVEMMNETMEEIVGADDKVEAYSSLHDLSAASGAGEIVFETIVASLSKQKTAYNMYDDGEWQQLEIVSIYLPTEKKAVAMVLDVSSQFKYEQLLTYQQQMESVSHLAAGVAHELRNPLSVIKGFLQLSKLTDSFEKYEKTILSEVNRMNNIIENFLSMAKRRWKHEIQKPTVVFDELDDIIRSECMLQDITYTSELHRGDEQSKMNSTMIKQVVLNLLRNSSEALQESARNVKSFTLETWVESAYYHIRVKDNGTGMSEETLQKMGRPFVTTKKEGTGVGIPLSKKIIEDHGGSFKIQSQLGHGTIIEMNIPLLEE